MCRRSRGEALPDPLGSRSPLLGLRTLAGSPPRIPSPPLCLLPGHKNRKNGGRTEKGDSQTYGGIGGRDGGR